MSGALQISGPASARLDEPLRLRLRGAGPEASVQWRARLRDDDGRVWRAAADSAEELDAGWRPARTPAGPHAALASLRPVEVQVRAELEDGRAAARSVTRTLLSPGVRVRRWRGEPPATLVLPADAPVATVVLDATAPDSAAPTVAAALLASQGVLVLVLGPATRPSSASARAAVLERLRAVPGATEPRVLDGAAVPLPPGVPTGGDPSATADRVAAWAALRAGLGAPVAPAPAAPRG